jgi:hypothetical protein
MARSRGVLSLYSFSVLIVLTFAIGARAQGGDPTFTQGFKPYGSFHGGDINVASMENGKLDLHAALPSYPQRGDLRMNFTIRYNNPTFSVNQLCPPYPPGAACNYVSATVPGAAYLHAGVSVVPDFATLNLGFTTTGVVYLSRTAMPYLLGDLRLPPFCWS